MNFCWVTIHVADMKKSLKFYTEIVGLPVSNTMNAGPMTIAFLGNGSTKVELICNPSAPTPSHGNDISIGFEVNTLDEITDRLQSANIPVQSGPFQPNPHIRFLFVSDPDGVKIQFVEKT